VADSRDVRETKYSHRTGIGQRKTILILYGDAMYIKPLKVSILAMVFGVLCVASATSAVAQKATSTTTTTKEPLVQTPLTCDTFEPISFTGFVKSVYEVKDSHDGTPLRVKMSVSWEDVVGTTPSGRVYKGNYHSIDQYDVDGLPSYHRTTTIERFKSKTKGGADTVYTLKLRIRIDAFGNVTQDKESEETECKP